MPRPFLVVALTAALLTTGCQQLGLAPARPDPDATRGAGRAAESRHVEVQHVLIAFDDADVAGVTRTREQAEALATQVYERARRGEGLERLVQLYSDDRDRRGIYRIANFGVEADGADEMGRLDLARGFGRGLADTAFRIQPGELTLVSHHEIRSPLGWHIVRRLR